MVAIGMLFKNEESTLLPMAHPNHNSYVVLNGYLRDLVRLLNLISDIFSLGGKSTILSSFLILCFDIGASLHWQ